MKVAAFALIALGILVGLVGVSAMSQSGADASRFLENAAPDRTFWIVVLGVVVFAAGVGALFPAFRKRPE